MPVGRLSCLTLILCAAGAAARADVATMVPLCNGCHGPDGASVIPGVPTIAGLSALVIENALSDYRSGLRPCPAPGTPGALGLNMCAPAGAIAEADLAGIAQHYSELPFRPKAQSGDEAIIARGRDIHERDCEICHTDAGANAADDASILAGQDIAYLRLSLMEYAAGTRAQPRPMEAKMMALSPDDIDALAQFYATRP